MKNEVILQMIKISSSVLCSKVFIQVCNTTCFHYIYEQIPDVSLCMVYVMLFMWSQSRQQAKFLNLDQIFSGLTDPKNLDNIYSCIDFYIFCKLQLFFKDPFGIRFNFEFCKCHFYWISQTCYGRDHLHCPLFYKRIFS